MPRILSTSRSDQHGFSKKPQAELRLIAGEGVEGDAHRGVTVQHLYLKRKNPNSPNLCQVHLFAAEKLAELAACGYALQPGDLGENLLTEGLDVLTLPCGTELHLGTEEATCAILKVTGLRTPCKQIDAFRPGLQQLLYGPPGSPSMKETLRAGIMAIVVRGGVVRPNDAIRVVLPPAPHQALGPV